MHPSCPFSSSCSIRSDLRAPGHDETAGFPLLSQGPSSTFCCWVRLRSTALLLSSRLSSAVLCSPHFLNLVQAVLAGKQCALHHEASVFQAFFGTVPNLHPCSSPANSVQEQRYLSAHCLSVLAYEASSPPIYWNPPHPSSPSVLQPLTRSPSKSASALLPIWAL